MKRRTLKKRIEILVLRVLLVPAAWLVRRLRWEQAPAVGNIIGILFYWFSRRYRKQVYENLMVAYGGEWTQAQMKQVAKQTFRNFARAGIEFFIADELNDDGLRRVMTIRGKENLDAALAKGKGAITVTAHLGNFEILARRLAQEGYKVNVIARNSDDPMLTGLFNSVRESAGYAVLPRDESVGPAVRCLHRNEVLGILPDQNTWGPCVFADFFGKVAATAIGPAVFSIRTGAPIVCAFAPRQPDGTYEMTIQPAIEFEPTGDREADVAALVQIFTSAIENKIREHPDQWLWLHCRWRRRPGDRLEDDKENALTGSGV